VTRPKGYALRRSLIFVGIALAVASFVFLPLLMMSLPFLAVGLVLALKNLRVDVEYWRARQRGAPLARLHESEPEPVSGTEPTA
jgi:hypothetical protein